MPPDRPTQGNRHRGSVVVRELVTGLRRLRLTKNIEIGKVIGLGGYADVHEGWMPTDGTDEKTKVAIKKLRLILGNEKEFAKVGPSSMSFSIFIVFEIRPSQGNCASGQGFDRITCYNWLGSLS